MSDQEVKTVTEEAEATPEQVGVVVLDVIFNSILDAFRAADDQRHAIVHGEPFASILLGKQEQK